MYMCVSVCVYIYIYIYIHIYIYKFVYAFGLDWFYGISTIVGYIMPNPFYSYILNIYNFNPHFVDNIFK